MKKEVVLIDDEEINLDILHNLLSGYEELRDYLISKYTNPKEALSYCIKSENVRLILVDQFMDELTGLEFIDEYNRLVPEEFRASIIMNSTGSSSEAISAALEKGADDYFVKPFDNIILKARIRNSLMKEDLRKETNVAKQNKEILLRVLIHDVMSPLTVATHLVKNLLKQKPEYESYLKIDDKLSSIAEIIQSVRDSEAIDAQKITLSKSDFILEDLLREVVAHTHAVISNKKIEIHIDNKLDSKQKVNSDRNILKYQILSNLLTNAVKFSQIAGVINFVITKEKGRVCLTLRDHGIGIPPRILADLFKWGARTSRKGTMNESGTGFGMPIVKKFILELGHEIEIQSWTEHTETQKQGTEIKIIF